MKRFAARYRDQQQIPIIGQMVMLSVAFIYGLINLSLTVIVFAVLSLMVLLPIWYMGTREILLTPESLEIRRFWGVLRETTRWADIDRMTLQADQDIRVERKHGAHTLWIGTDASFRDAMVEAMQEFLARYGSTA